jgi:uncharacterized metal-binding protein YceD (DUF177 family)
MGQSGQYHINILGLENKTFSYTFIGDAAFFKSFEQDLSGSFVAEVVLKKSAIMLQVQFQINAEMHLICDRSLRPFTENFISQSTYIFRFGDKAEVMSDEMEVIPQSTAVIDLKQHLYDFIQLSIPLKRIHPDLRIAPEDEQTLLYSTEKENTPGQAPVDPRWAELLKIKNKLN